jgi:tetratricopeptide (TPR) repeat protein
MFTDVAGFTSLMEKDEARAMAVLERCRNALFHQLESFSGVLVKVMGDGTLCTFSHASSAVECARFFQESIKDSDFRVRIGIHWGDVIQASNDIFGDTVNVASRLERLTLPGSICISREILNGCGTDELMDVRSLGLRRLKGLGRLIEVYVIEGNSEHSLPGTSDTDEIEKHADEEEVPSVAVIPFENLGSGKESYYAYGISADLASDISRAGNINVASLSDVARALDEKLSRDEIAARLGVRYLATGSLLKDKSKFRISVELIDCSDSRIIWVDSWEDDWYSLSAIKGKLADGLLKALGIEPGVFPGMTEMITANTDAYELYLRGRHIYSRRSTRNDLEKVRQVLKRSIELDPDLVQARVMLGGTYRDQGKFVKGTEILREALDIAVGNDDPVGQLKALNGIGISLWRQSRLSEAKDTFEDVLELSERISDRIGQARALNNLGLVEWSSGNFSQALSCFRESLAIADELTADSMQADTLCNIGLVKASLGDDSAALEYYGRALEIQSGKGNLDRQTHIMINMGNSSFRSGAVDRALSIFKQSLATCRKLGDYPGECKSLNNLGNVMVYLGLFEAGRTHYLEAREIAKKQADLSMEGIILSGIGLLELRSGFAERSLPPLLDSLRICRETRDREGESEVLAYVGDTYLNLGSSIEALEVLRDSLAIMEEIGSKNLKAYAMALLSKAIVHEERSRAAVSEAVQLIESSLDNLSHQNVKDRAEVYSILADTYLTLGDCNYPDLIDPDRCKAGYKEMMSSARDALLIIADRFSEPGLKKSFMEEIPLHVEIIAITDRKGIPSDENSDG